LLDTLELMIHDVNKHIIDGEKILDLNKIKFSEFCKDMDKSEVITLEQLDDILKDLK